MDEDEPLKLNAIIGAFAIVAVGSFFLTLLPSGIWLVLAAWTLVSVPVGMIIGHCASYGGRKDRPAIEDQKIVSHVRRRRILRRTWG